jgi:hypothetical protein
MFGETPPDRFDNVRQAWIGRHAGPFPIQKRRAEVLNRRIRDRHREMAGAQPSPYNDNVIKPLVLRPAYSTEGYIEAVVVSVAALLVPIGWTAGIVLYQRILTLIPQRLRCYPTLALLWASAGLGALTLCLYDHGTGLDSALVTPWFFAQIPAAFLTAGIYGILNGWLAVDGATEWWPMVPQSAPADADYPMGPDDITGPGIFFRDDLDAGEQLTPIAPDEARPRGGSAMLIIAALVVSALGIIWTVATVFLGVKDCYTSPVMQPVPGNTTAVQPSGMR